MHNPPLILVADDSVDFQEIMGAKLRDAGFWVAQAQNGREAVDRAISIKPDLILLDIQMPEQNGTEAILEIRQHAELKETKIIFFTALADPWPLAHGKNIDMSKELGATEFIAKSEDLNKIVELVKKELATISQSS